MIKRFLKLFKHINKKPTTSKAKKYPKEWVWNYEDVKEDLEQLYRCSVQKTASDFQVKEVTLNGSTVNVAMDSACDSHEVIDTIKTAFEMQLQGQEVIFSYFARQGFIGFNNCSILGQDWLIRKAIVAPCEDAAAVGYDVTLKDDEITDEDKEQISEMQTISDDKLAFDITTIMNRFAQNKRKYGQSICIPLIDGVDYEIPFNIDAVDLGSYKGMTIVEPIWFAPVLDTEAMTNPMSRRFYQPTWFRMPNGQLIHHSWCIFNTYGEPSDILKPTYYFGGIPLPQLLYEQVYAAHKTAKEAPMLAQSKRLNYVEGSPNALLFNPEAKRQFDFISWVRNNFGFLLIKPDQKIGQLDTTLTDFDNVVMLTYQIVAAISGVVSTRLLETSPKGWQSSGSYEDRQYIKLQQGIQKHDFTPILDMHYRLLAKSKYGIDKRYIIDFEEIDTPTAKEAAEIREINARTDATYINAGVVAPEEVRDVLREDEKSGYNALEEEMPEGAGVDPFSDIETNEEPNNLFPLKS